MNSIQQIFQEYGPSYLDQFGNDIPSHHKKVIAAIQNCRSGNYGLCVYRCEDCGEYHIQAQSCGNRHCPTCQHGKTQQWLQKQLERQLPGHHFMVTFTVPELLRTFIRSHQKEAYNGLFGGSADAIKKLSADPKRLGGNPGFFGVLHTWGRVLQYHPHIHYIVPGGVLDENHCWKPSDETFLLPVRALSPVFRAKFRDLMDKAGLLHEIPSEVWNIDWNVNCQPVGSAEATLKYLAPYVFKVAISDSRIIEVKDGFVTFSYKKSHSNRIRNMTLPAHEFMRRFLQHVLLTGFMKVRYYGFLNPTHKMPLNELKGRIEMCSGFEITAPDIEQSAHTPPGCKSCSGHLQFQCFIPPQHSRRYPELIEVLPKPTDKPPPQPKEHQQI